ncbi:MAG: SCO family protein [Thermomicrobiales bacterium]|nr:SCO family protein [Thermomicrobiales bacterium]
MTTEREQSLPTEPEASGTPAGPPSRVRKLIGGAVLAVIAIAAVAFLVNWSQEREYVFHGGVFTPPAAAAPLDLADQNGEPFSLDQVKGDVALVYFGYTTCPDVCPTTLTDFQAVKEGLGAEADRVKFVMVTIDPERDTAAKLKEYLGFFDSGIIGLRGDAAQTEEVSRDYGITVKRVEYPESATKYLLDHTALVYLIDPEGRLLLTFPYGTDPALIAQDVLHVLAAEPGRAA